jgi:hypothetical protein
METPLNFLRKIAALLKKSHPVWFTISLLCLVVLLIPELWFQSLGFPEGVRYSHSGYIASVFLFCLGLAWIIEEWNKWDVDKEKKPQRR